MVYSYREPGIYLQEAIESLAAVHVGMSISVL